MKQQWMQREDGRYLIFYDTAEKDIEGSIRPPGKFAAAMPGNTNHLRWDPTLCEWVTYAPQRQDRTFLPPADWCPLCPTKPGSLPTEIPRRRYEMVVFENLFPSYRLNAVAPDEMGSLLTPSLPG